MPDRSDFKHLTEGLATTSDRIRALHRAGVSKGDIADFLQIEPNHVYSTISRDKSRAKSVKVANGAEASATHPAEIVVMIHTNEKGELVLNAEINKALQLKPKEKVVVFAFPGQLTVMTREKAALRLQNTVRNAAPAEAALAAALLEIDADANR